MNLKHQYLLFLVVFVFGVGIFSYEIWKIHEKKTKMAELREAVSHLRQIKPDEHNSDFLSK